MNDIDVRGDMDRAKFEELIAADLAVFEKTLKVRYAHRAPTHPPLPLRVAKKNPLNEEINPLLPTGIGERFSQTIVSNLGHAALLRQCELPL
jgi:hypothetical protein